MTAVEGGSVACFVVRVLETHQYLNRGRGITSLIIPPWVGGQRAREFLSESAGFCPVCVAEIKVLAVESAGYPPILGGVWAGLNGRRHVFRGLPKYKVWVGQPGPIYRDCTWRK